MKYYRDVLCPKVESGDVVKYELQKPYILQPQFSHNGIAVRPIEYVADFYIVYKDGHEEVIDTKGCPDSVAKIKRKMFWFVYPTLIYKWIVYSKKYGGWMEYEEYQKYSKDTKKMKRVQEKMQCTLIN